MTRQIEITRSLAIHLLSLAQQSPEHEICGLIGARDNRPITLYPITNVSTTPSVSFELDPQEQINAQKKIRENKEELFAIFHSHPQGAAVPSEKDIKDIGYPNVYQIIISLDTKGVLEMRAYKIGADGCEEITLTV